MIKFQILEDQLSYMTNFLYILHLRFKDLLFINSFFFLLIFIILIYIILEKLTTAGHKGVPSADALNAKGLKRWKTSRFAVRGHPSEIVV